MTDTDDLSDILAATRDCLELARDHVAELPEGNAIRIAVQAAHDETELALMRLDEVGEVPDADT